MDSWKLFNVDLPIWIYAPLLLALWIVVGFGLKAFFFHRLHRIAERTASGFDDTLIKAMSIPLNLLILASGLLALAQWTPLGEDVRARTDLHLFLAIITILAGVLFADRLLRGLIVLYAERVDVFRTAGGILQGLARGLIVVLGLLMLLDTLGVSITPIVASLGIGSLAVALALQPTLENFFAGLQIVIDKPVLPGHFVKLESGEEGYVEKIGWRSTWIRMLPNNMIIIPNKQLVSSRVVNYYYPEKELAVLVDVGVHYASDLERVERVTIEVAEQMQRTVSGAVREFMPFIRYHTFDRSSINFSVIMRAQEFTDNYLIKHEFVKALQSRYATEGIKIPFPISAINLDQEGAVSVFSSRRAPTDDRR
ncbi:MAG TPA: mechanosensitive ion channel family protein [Methylomirabilota bacterium]|nr:mechanosensitive ion channel family protein [Methylomirabilota bacterium]